MGARAVVCAGVVCLTVAASSVASANVLNLGGTRNPANGQWTGLASLETVPVRNAGNAGELSGAGAGGWGQDRICGAVSYEYRIGKYEVTAGQYCEFLNAVAKTDTYGLYNANMWSINYGCKIKQSGSSGGLTYSVATDYANRPVNYVSFGDACRFANWLHNGQPVGLQNGSTTENGVYTLNGATSNADLKAVTRKWDWEWAVASEDEWYKAAYHKNDGATGSYFDYPTSSNNRPGVNPYETTNPGNNANYNDHGYLIGSPYYRTVVGEFELSDSAYGTFDQGGNVWEWNEAVLNDKYRGVRGGSFHFQDYFQHAIYRDYLNTPANEDLDIGFRVVQVPEPTALALLALGGIGMLTRRRDVRR